MGLGLGLEAVYPGGRAQRAAEGPLFSLRLLVICSHAASGRLLAVPADSSGPSSTVSSAGPSSPTTADTSPRFSFSDKVTLTPQSSEEAHAALNASSQPLNVAGPQDSAPLAADIPLTPNNSPDAESEPCAPAEESPPCPQGAPEAAPAPADDPALRAPCSAPAELALGRMEGYCLPGSLPVLLELRESSSEAGSSSLTPQSPDGPDEFFDTQESLEVWLDSPESPPGPEPPSEGKDTE